MQQFLLQRLQVCREWRVKTWSAETSMAFLQILVAGWFDNAVSADYNATLAALRHKISSTAAYLV